MHVRSLLVVGLFAASTATGAEPIDVVDRLYRGEWSLAEQQLRRQTAEDPANDDARLQLGFVQTLRAIERFAGFQWEYGARFDRGAIFVPGMTLARPNPTPNRVSYIAWRRHLETLHNDLQQAEQTLAAIKGDRARFKVEFAKLQWDPDGDGKAEPLLPRGEVDPLRTLREANPQFEVGFDETDALWLRGYCRLFMGTLNLILSVDLSELFYHFAAEVYRDPIVPEAYAKLTPEERAAKWWDALVRMKLSEPDRWHAARLDWIKVTELSEAMWKSAERETDDDREWIPNPRQTGAVRVKVTPEMISAWTAGATEVRALLEGRKLVRPWVFLGRPPKEERGVNVKRLFDDPPKKPLFQWILNSPGEYLEAGEIADEGVFRRMNEVFGPNLPWFGLWLN